MTSRVSILLLCAIQALPAADRGAELLAAAKKGQAAQVAALLDKHTPIDSRDKEQRTPLMLAARQGHARVVELLLERGADAAARDREGFTAYGVALLSSSAARDAVLDLLPKPTRRRVVLEPVLAADNLYSSCLMLPAELAKFVRGIKPEAMVASAVREAAVAPGPPVQDIPMEFVPAEGDLTLTLRVRPQASCVQQQGGDAVSMAIDARLTAGEKVLLERTFGGGLKGMHAPIATSPAQYGAYFADWAKGHGAAIYWAAVSAILKSE